VQINLFCVDLEHFCVDVEHFWSGDLVPLQHIPPPSLCGSQGRCLPPLLRIPGEISRHTIGAQCVWRRLGRGHCLMMVGGLLSVRAHYAALECHIANVAQ